MIIHELGGAAVSPVRATMRLTVDERLDETITLRRCALQRSVFKGSAVSFPAEVLRFDAVADWIRRHGFPVDVTCAEELDRVLRAGIAASHVVMQCAGGAADPVQHAVVAGVRRFIIDSSEHLAVLERSFAKRPHPVMVDASSFDRLAGEAAAHSRLDLVGLHCRLGGVDVAGLPEIVVETMATMACFNRKHGVVLSRMSLGDVDLTQIGGNPRGLHRVAEMIDDAVVEGCERFRCPRPALTLSPCRSTLMPTT